ncbi:MAG: hypothetical protein N3D84_01330 [Candidatus Woesearchaeota archaeon]|nr:hypothetical protein [Candidatus Woesearchaeota archaeon]
MAKDTLNGSIKGTEGDSLYSAPQTPEIMMIRRAVLVNGLVKLGSEKETRGDFEGASRYYLSAYLKDTTNEKVRQILYGCLANLKKQKTEMQAPANEIKAIDNIIEKIIKDYGNKAFVPLIH